MGGNRVCIGSPFSFFTFFSPFFLKKGEYIYFISFFFFFLNKLQKNERGNMWAAVTASLCFFFFFFLIPFFSNKHDEKKNINEGTKWVCPFFLIYFWKMHKKSWGYDPMFTSWWACGWTDPMKGSIHSPLLPDSLKD